MADDRQDERQTLNPAALAVADAARTLGLPVETVREDIAAGAPTNADGTMNLVHYAAWLNGQMTDGD